MTDEALDELLAALLLAELPTATAGLPTHELEALLVAAIAHARSAWPNVSLAPEVFVRHLAQNIPAGEQPRAWLPTARVAELYLACAGAHGDAQALAMFEERFLPEAERALSKMGISATLSDEVKQRLRCQLFVGEGSELPLITDYAGRGDLKSWLRSVAVRAALKVLQRERKHVPLDEDLENALPAFDDNPELAHLRSTYAADFSAAFGEAIRSLTPRDRNLLRGHLLDSLSIDQLGALYKVHRATAARWIVKVRETLLERTRDLLMQRLGLSASEFESVMRLLRSRLDISLHQLLRQDAP